MKFNYQNNLQSRKDSEFVFSYVYLLYYKCYRINPNYTGSYMDYPDWIKNKKPKQNLSIKKEKHAFNMH